MKIRITRIIGLIGLAFVIVTLSVHDRVLAQQVESWTSVKGDSLAGKGLYWNTDGINIVRASDGKNFLIPFEKLQAKDVLRGVKSLPFHVNDQARLRAKTSSSTSKSRERNTGRYMAQVELFSYDGYTFRGSGTIFPIKEKYRISGRTVEVDLSSPYGDGYAGVEFFAIKGKGKDRKIFHSEAGVRSFRGIGSKHYFSFDPVENLQGWVVVIRSPNTGEIIKVGSSMRPLENFIISRLPKVAKMKIKNKSIKDKIVKAANIRMK